MTECGNTSNMGRRKAPSWLSEAKRGQEEATLLTLRVSGWNVIVLSVLEYSTNNVLSFHRYHTRYEDCKQFVGLRIKMLITTSM
jgi:hypothetical protein